MDIDDSVLDGLEDKLNWTLCIKIQIYTYVFSNKYLIVFEVIVFFIFLLAYKCMEIWNNNNLTFNYLNTLTILNILWASSWVTSSL